MMLGITGHRPEHINFEWNYNGPVSKWIKDELAKKFAIYKPESVMSGMALGVDTIAALLAIELCIPIIAVIPFLGQESKWNEKQKALYHKILAHKLCIVKIVCEPGYAAWKIQRRNEWLCNECDNLIAVWDGSEGGTKNTILYAESIQKEIEYINLDVKKIK